MKLGKLCVDYEPPRYFANFYIAGFTYYEGADVASTLQVGNRVELYAEPKNPFDPNAVAIYFGKTKLGYVPSASNNEIFNLLYFGHDVFEAKISQICLDANPERQVRVVLNMKDANSS